MTIAVRSRTKLAAALLAAGVTASPALVMPVHDELPVLSDIAVRPASVVTDALLGVGDVVGAATYAVYLPVDLVVSLPFDTLYTAASALQDPAAVGNLLSWLGQRYLNPSDNYYIPDYYGPGLDYLPYTYPWDFKVSVLEPLANVLPTPLSDNVISALNSVADAINDSFAALPNPAVGDDAVSALLYDNVAASTLRAVQLGILAPVIALVNVVSFAGYVPADLEATVEAAIKNPADVPGLLSQLVYNVLDPYSGLLGGVVGPFVNAGSWLPAPLGVSATDDGLIVNAYVGFADAVDNLLSSLPAPVSPYDALSTPSTAAPQSLAAVEADTVLASASGVAEVPAKTQTTFTLDVPDNVAVQPVSEKLAVLQSPADEKQTVPTSPEPQVSDEAPAADQGQSAQGSEADGAAVADKDEPATPPSKRDLVKDGDSTGGTGLSKGPRHVKSGVLGSVKKSRQVKSDDGSVSGPGSSKGPGTAKPNHGGSAGGSAAGGGKSDSGTS